MDNFIEMDFDEFVETYKPITNHIDKNASFDGLMFETYGDEYEFVKQSNEKHIWMYGDGDDGGSYIWNGFHYVNRLGYFITEVPAPSEEECVIQIKVSSYWYYCEGCGAEIEDDGQLINDKFYDWQCCPLCATVEQLKEIEETHANN